MDNVHASGIQLLVLKAGQVLKVELVDSFETGTPQVELLAIHLVVRHPRLMAFLRFSAAARVGFRIKFQTRLGLRILIAA